ncbi:hypothetical protein ABB37_09011 [Leptomonas pyrrhocoris]|uniref:BAR domain-containing protein n=1 Tax=Leptomonas pyrrhocoris TaxID=157538 RepID=A0A0M9FRP6_LEPPY|nr:hypothetical protein ABB37_09011 [Leptomonas pyrrhocoris]XP_015653125.1 hypothetical protein ABB37_09011 [Leptomonas pyrrhocoris]KPA74685.1 hypothetical protein ABB37_09011 [Leptomonas pyrrhocoris]KPA74686.1 hypothetical protein ABB37_09011 [Leptomonas pyrrhocoris]|eukprot:XP_015653124.1 hypothetical protein ABB37_09011 [Leptomonas pyrrhocoris]
MSKIQKFRADMSRRFDPEGATLTAYRDYDFERRANDVRRLQLAVEHFDHAVTQGMVAMKEIASAYEAVGQAFTELTLTNNNPVPGPDGAEEPNPYPTEADVQFMAQQQQQQQQQNSTSAPEYAGSVASTRMPDEANSQVRRLAKIFAEEARHINEGQPFQTYNAGIHRDVITRLRPVTEHLKGVDGYRRERTEALAKYNRYKADVEKVEKQYTKKGKPFCDSKSHKKFAEKRDKAWQEYIKRRDKFNDTFSMLMEVNDHAAAQIIHRYLVLNHEYLQQLVGSMDRVLPAMAEVYPLNSEYNSIQNSLLLEAVANAKAPFADHAKELQEKNAAAAAAAQNGAAGSPRSAVSEKDDDMPDSSLTPLSSDGAKNTASTSRLEEPGGYETRVEPTTVLESAEPPHEPEDDVHNAGETEEDHGHIETQPQRLQTQGEGMPPKDQEARPPGTVEGTPNGRA